MKIRTINDLEAWTIEFLKKRIADGDNEAADVLLNHLREQSIIIDKWRTNKQANDFNASKPAPDASSKRQAS